MNLAVIADGLSSRIMRVAADTLEATPWTRHEDRTPTPWLHGDERGRDGGVRQELAAGVTTAILSGPQAVKREAEEDWGT
jgi:hypothetical protein